MIRSHLYASKPETTVYRQPADDGQPVYHLRQGDWVGVLERADGWIRIMGITCDGWVRATDLEERPPFKLHAQWSADQPIQYVSQR